MCYWSRLLRVPWTARRSNQSILKEISPEYSLKGLMLKLNLQYCGYLMQSASSSEKTLMLGKIEGRRRRDNRGWDGWMASSIQWTWVWANSRTQLRTEEPGVLQSMGLQRVRHDGATELIDWYGRGVWRRMDTCICMAKSLCCPPETIIILLIGYMPI